MGKHLAGKVEGAGDESSLEESLGHLQCLDNALRLMHFGWLRVRRELCEL